MLALCKHRTRSRREQCNCSTAMACSVLSSPCSRCSAAHLRPAFKRQKASCQVEPTIHAGLDLGLQCHRRSTRSLIVVERTRSGKERKWHLSSRKKARLDAGAMACQHEPSAAALSRRPRAEDAMSRRCVGGESAVGEGGPSPTTSSMTPSLLSHPMAMGAAPKHVCQVSARVSSVINFYDM